MFNCWYPIAEHKLLWITVAYANCWPIYFFFDRYPEPYTAYFLPGSDSEFTVSPQAGELLPLDTAGTFITVGFKPSMYSKKHKATLVIQVRPKNEILDTILVDLRIFFLLDEYEDNISIAKFSCFTIQKQLRKVLFPNKLGNYHNYIHFSCCTCRIVNS